MSINIPNQNEIRKIVEETLEAVQHVHTFERWFGKSADQSGNNWCTEDRLVAFRATSGNNDFGSDAGDIVKLVGSDDTPITLDANSYDPNQLLIVAVSSSTEYYVRIIWGIGTVEEAIAAGNYSTKMVKFDAINPQQSANAIIDLRTKRLPIGCKLWAQCKNVIDNATLDFYFGLHEYNLTSEFIP